MSASQQSQALLIQDLVHRYPRQGAPALTIEGLAVPHAEHMVLTGQSGSGKSTLLHLIAGLMRPTDGTILVDGLNLLALRPAKRDRIRGRRIGMVFQNYQLLSGFSVIENVLAALMFSDIPRGAHRQRATDLLTSLGINTPAARIDELSIGQQQRVAVARAIACSPSLVLADEPTAALDPGFAATAMDLLQQACRSINAALLCVTHDMTLIERFDRHERLEDLAITADAAATGGA